jgi:hypothetical protein
MTSDYQTDIVVMDVPLLIRIMEWAREDSKTDMELHVVAENAVRLMLKKDILSMKEYAPLVKKSKK